MRKRGEAARQPARAPLPPRTRKRWLVAACVAAFWLFLLDITGSVISATLLLAFLAGLGVACVIVLRTLGISRDHPYVRQLASRPWRDGQEVLQLALRHMSEVFVVTPSGSLIAPDVVELRLHPDNLSSLTERMDIGLIAESAAEVYAEQVAARGARFAGLGPAQVHVIADPAVPAGRYRLRQGQPVDIGHGAGLQFAAAGAELPGAHLHDPEFLRTGAQSVYAAAPPAPAGLRPADRGSAAAPADPAAPGAPAGPWPVPDAKYPGFTGHDGNTRAQPAPGHRTVTDLPTVIEIGRGPVPVLRLVTEGSTAETRVSGARAGRGAVELRLPDVPTVSREHARFTYSDGRWWIANLGRNGLTLNGAALAGEQPLSHGDSIRWGMRPDAPLSRVEIG